MTSDSKPYRGYPSGSVRMPPRTPHPHPQHRGSPSPVGGLPKRVALECCKALPQTPAPPLAGWLASSAGVSGSFAPPALPGFIATANPSAAAPRIGTRLLTVLPLGGLPWHRGNRFPRSAQEVSRRLHAGRRPASRPASAELHPRPKTGVWFRQHPFASDTSLTVHLRSSYQRTPDGFPRLFRNAHHTGHCASAACGGLDPDPAIRARGASPHLLCSKAASSQLPFTSEPPLRAVVAHGHPQPRRSTILPIGNNLALSGSVSARPNIARFKVLSRMIWPSVCPLLQGSITALRTTYKSIIKVLAKFTTVGVLHSFASSSHRSRFGSV
jgi:hypothetical protein